MKLYSKVELITSCYKEEGIVKGTIGIIIATYETGDIEVQFLDKDGNQTDLYFAVHPSDVRVIH